MIQMPAQFNAIKRSEKRVFNYRVMLQSGCQIFTRDKYIDCFCSITLCSGVAKSFIHNISQTFLKMKLQKTGRKIEIKMRRGKFLAFPVITWLILIECTAIAQKQPYPYNIRINYEMTYQPDSTDQKNTYKEYTTLSIGKNQSVFCTTNYLIIDSAMNSELSKGNTTGVSMGFMQANPNRVFFVIFKSDTGITTYDEPAPYLPTPALYKYSEPKDAFHWNILSDTLSIGGLLCQKAEVRFGNRSWIAWFAPSIPVSDGPYKFCGLPGLIINISDKQGYWNFKLANLQNRDTTIKVHFNNKIAQPLPDKQDYLDKKKYSRDNRFELMKMSGFHFSDEVTTRQRLKEFTAKDNNWIELFKENGK
jgi:GLPGLI family protein